MAGREAAQPGRRELGFPVSDFSEAVVLVNSRSFESSTLLLPQAECGPGGSLGLWVQREEFQRPLAQHPSSPRRGCASRGPTSTRPPHSHPGSGSVRVSAPNSPNNGQVLTITHRLSPHVPRPSHLWAYCGHPHSLQGLCQAFVHMLPGSPLGIPLSSGPCPLVLQWGVGTALFRQNSPHFALYFPWNMSPCTLGKLTSTSFISCVYCLPPHRMWAPGGAGLGLFPPYVLQAPTIMNEQTDSFLSTGSWRTPPSDVTSGACGASSSSPF